MSLKVGFISFAVGCWIGLIFYLLMGVSVPSFVWGWTIGWTLAALYGWARDSSGF